MRSVRDFPFKYENINQYIEEISIPNADFGTGGNDDFFVRFKDGKSYAFTAFTTSNIQELMRKENLKSFVSPGMVVVSEISIDSILEVVEEILELSNNKPTRLDHFGILQT